MFNLMADTTMVFVVTIKIRVGTLFVIEDFALIIEGYLVAPSGSNYFATSVYSLMILERLTPSKHYTIVNIRWR